MALPIQEPAFREALRFLEGFFAVPVIACRETFTFRLSFLSCSRLVPAFPKRWPLWGLIFIGPSNHLKPDELGFAVDVQQHLVELFQQLPGVTGTHVLTGQDAGREE